MSLLRLLSKSLVLVFVLSFTVSASLAQITGVNSTTLTPVPGSGHDYIRMLNETVNPYNGSPSVRIEIPMARGRGLTVPFGLAYDANGVHFTLDSGVGGYWSSNVGFISKGGWSYTLPQVTYTAATKDFPNAGPPYSCDYNTNYIFFDPLGGRHNLVLNSSSSGDSRCFNLPARLNSGDVYYLANLSADYSTVTVSDLDGTAYKFTNGQCLPGFNLCSYQPVIEDRNGNTITVTSTGGGGAAFNVADTVGRTVLSSSGFGATGNTLSVSGVAQPYTLTWGTATSNFTLGITSPIPQEPCPNGTNGFPAHDSETQSVITALTLPNGKQYQFSYDPTYGLLNQITYPTGAWIKYTWGVNPQSEFLEYDNINVPLARCIVDWFAVLHRYVSFDGTNIALQQDFSYPPTSWNGIQWTTKQTTVVTKDCARNNFVCSSAPSSTTVYTYSPSIVFSDDPLNQGAGNQVPVEQTITYKDGSGNTLRTVSKNWLNIYLLQSDQTTLENNLTSKKTYSYVSPGAGVYQALIAETDEYDYGQGAPGALLRKIVTNYASFPATPIYPFAPSILDRPSSVITYDGNANRVAETDYGYDQTSVASASASQHDETHYGPGFNNRGNATTVTRQCFISSTTCTNPVTTFTYDETGQVLSVIDPCGNAGCSDVTGTNHTTNYSYADNFDSNPSSNTNAYLTQITRPPTNSVNHVEKFKYAYSDGQLIQSIDENNQVTSHFYADPLRRLTETDYPDGGKTTIAYNDASYNPSTPSPSVTTTKVATPSPNLITLTVFDGLGHTVRTVLTSDLDCASGDRTDTTYDGLGRIYTASNPYCSTGDSTYGLTAYANDALGRTTQVTQPDGSAVTTSYSGNTTTVTDEAGKKRQSTTDGLGRLAQIVEDPGGLGYVTTYSYDGLSNLTGVVQNGSRQRAFGYDSLSRLTSATNPESGTIAYTYDNNGNVATRTDARNITTYFGYDALNRLVQKTYSDNTPGSFYAYDQITYPGYQTNVIGRLTSEGTWDGTCWQTGIYFGYDQMGRSNFELHALFEGDTTGCPYVQTYFTATYDLAGNQTSLTYPSGRVVKSQVNGASRLTKVYVDDFNGYNYLNSANYAPFGSATSFALGNGVTETSTYNKRLQPLNQQVANPTSTLINRTYGFGTSGHDNGNVMSITDNLNSVLTQNFSYDSLNRLSTAQTVGTSGPNCWGQQFGYDPWGNLLTETPNVPGCPTNALSLGVNANNQITNTGFSYDTAGNLLADGSHTYTFDAENHITQLDGGSTATYTYDAEGRRMAKKIGSATTEYIYFNGDVLTEYNLGDQVWSDYIFAGSRRLAAAGTDDIFNPGFEQGLEGWRTWAGDSSGSEQVITDAARARSGTKYLQLSTTTAQLWTGNQLIAVNPGDQLTFGGWVYLEPGSATGGYVGWNIAVLDANGNVLAYYGASNVTSGAWTYQSLTYTVPSGGASVWLYAQIYAPTGLTTARFDDAFLTGASGQGVHYYHADHLGSARLMTDASGNQSWSATYLPFGQEWNPQPTTNHYKFTGKERDSESGLDNFGARYDSSSMGRFMSPDPNNVGASATDPQSWNGYSYVRNNPLNLTDPDGRSFFVCVKNDEGTRNCTIYENDQDFYRDAAASGATLSGGNIYVNGTQIGSYQHYGSGYDDTQGTLPDNIIAPTVEFGVLRNVVGGVQAFFEGLLGNGARVGVETITGLYGSVTREALEAAANSGGPTVRLVTNLTQAPAAGRALSAAVGEGAETLANAAREAGTTYVANVPKALLTQLENAGLAFPSTTNMGGAVAQEIRFAPQAAEFIAKSFRAVPK